MPAQEQLLKALSSFDAGTRRAALTQLLAAQPVAAAEKPWVNMHLHTFFSYNGEGWSPARLAWEARQTGLYGAAICDFDVLAGLEEFLWATDLVEVRASAGFETRVFFDEYAEHEINSPGEPGVFYFMGVGFVRPPAPASHAGQVFTAMLTQSHARNRALIGRINGKLDGLALDYDADVLPLTPQQNATERHIVRAYFDKALAQADGDRPAAARFWAANLGLGEAELTAKMADTNGFVDLLRSKMMKKGGLGYVQPGRETFPLLDDVLAMILECEGIPMATWLDGTRSGEADPQAQLECLIGKGVAATNIVPDRNWNFSDPDQKARMVAELQRYATAARDLDLPINVGTELNKPGQRFVDDFEVDAMRPLQGLFLDGARVMVGHTRLLRYANFSYVGQAARAEYPDRKVRNAVFARVGALPAPDAATRAKLADMAPTAAFACLQDCAGAGRWR